MKKFSILTAALLGLGFSTMSAQVSAEMPLSREHQVQNEKVTYAPQASAAPVRTAPRGAAPTSIIGRKYVTFFDSFTNYGNCAYYFIVEQADNDSVLLKGLADGYDLKGKYDAATGVLTIPVNKVIGHSSGGADIISHNLLASSGYASYNDTPVTILFSGDSVTFTDGFYANIATGGGYVKMGPITAKTANGSLKVSRTNVPALTIAQSWEYPILATRTSDKIVEVQGLASWLYHHNYKVPFSITRSSNQATLNSTKDTIDYYKASDTDIRYFFMRYRNVDTVNSVSQTPKFNIVVSGDKSTISSEKLLFWGYQKTGSTSLSGYYLRPFELTIDFNVYTQPLAGQYLVDSIYYTIDRDTRTATVDDYVAGLVNAVVKDSIQVDGQWYVVTTLGKECFYKSATADRTIVSLSLPATLTTVDDKACSTMSNLKELRIADLESWCKIDFSAGTSSVNNPMSNVYLPVASPDKWGKTYFNGVATTDLVIPEGITSLMRTFAGFRALTSVKLPASMRTLGDQAFQNCISLTKVEMQEGIETIGSAFYGCNTLTSIDLPRTVTELSGSTFYNCAALTDVGLHTGLKTIKYGTFYGCKALTKLTLPSTLDSIGTNVFTSCSAITSVTSRATTPPAVANDAIFSAFAENATLYVPSETAVTAYRAADGWKNFSAVMKDTSGVTAAETDNDNTPAVYYNLQGVKMNPDRMYPGIYIERRGNKTRKVVIR